MRMVFALPPRKENGQAIAITVKASVGNFESCLRPCAADLDTCECAAAMHGSPFVDMAVKVVQWGG